MHDFLPTLTPLLFGLVTQRALFPHFENALRDWTKL